MATTLTYSVLNQTPAEAAKPRTSVSRGVSVYFQLSQAGLSFGGGV